MQHDYGNPGAPGVTQTTVGQPTPLPFTGAETGSVVGLALVAFGVGVLLVVVGRRLRRTLER